MSKLISVDHDFQNANRIVGLQPAIANGQPLIYEQLPIGDPQLSDWSGTYEIGGAFPLTENVTIILPDIIAGDINRIVVLKRLDRTAYTVTVQAPPGQTLTLTGSTDLNAYGGQMTIRVTSLTTSEQIANSVVESGNGVQTTTITIPKASRSHEQVFARPGTLATQSVRVWLGPTTVEDENDLFLLENAQVNALCGTDEITFFFSSQDFELGSIKLSYQVI
jgi:hypothetical protein